MKEPNLNRTTVTAAYMGKATCSVCGAVKRCTHADSEMKSLGHYVCNECVVGLVVADLVLNSPQTGLTRPAA